MLRHADYAGVVEAVGGGVTGIVCGDEVFGMSIGTFAELVHVAAEGVVAKPANLTFEQAAAIPVAGITALQGLRDRGAMQAGQRVLVIGAGRGVGSFAVQIAKAFGATVTAATSADQLEHVRSLGADTVIDYTDADFTRRPERYG